MELDKIYIDAPKEKEPIIREILKEALEECASCGIEYGNVVSIKLNHNKSSWGTCYKVPLNDTYGIELNSRLFDSETVRSAVKETLLHELCHTVPNGHGHKGGWKVAANKLNVAYGYNVQRCDSAKDKNIVVPDKPSRYLIKCTNCGATFRRERASSIVLHPEKYRCQCGGKIVRER